MNIIIHGMVSLLILISLSFSGCLQQEKPSGLQQEIQSEPLPEVYNNPGTFDSPYYGISFQYP